MIKVYCSSEHSKIVAAQYPHLLPFDIEYKKFTYTNNIKDADVIPVFSNSSKEIEEQINVIKPHYNNQLILIMRIEYFSENSETDYFYNCLINEWAPLTTNVKVLHLNSKLESQIYYDFLWNRHRACFLENKVIDIKDRFFSSGVSEEMFKLAPIKKTSNPKRFLIPNKINYQNVMNLQNVTGSVILSNVTPENCYVSDLNELLLPCEEFGREMNDDEIHFVRNSWCPIQNDIYNDSIISVYVEAIINGDNIKVITERTLTPLIKGHFILPYGYQGLVKDIQAKGFYLPDWIDYSYDNIEDGASRFQAFLLSLKKLNNMKYEKLVKKMQKSSHLLLYNRLLFSKIKNDSLFNSLISVIK